MIPGTVLRDSSELTPSECSVCGVAAVVGIQVVWRTLRGEWRMARYCRTCAKRNGDLEE